MRRMLPAWDGPSTLGPFATSGVQRAPSVQPPPFGVLPPPPSSLPEPGLRALHDLIWQRK